MSKILFEGVVMDTTDGWTWAVVIPARSYEHAVAGMEAETGPGGLYEGCVSVVAHPFDDAPPKPCTDCLNGQPCQRHPH
jgi:hypothetical protein